MRPNITEQHMPINPFTRPGYRRVDTSAIDWHWNGNGGMNEFDLASYFVTLSEQDRNDEIPDRFAGANYCVGPEAIIEIVPPEEMTYTAGANGITSFYSPAAKRLFGAKFTRYGTESKRHYDGAVRWLSPNYLTVSIELVHPDNTGQFMPETLNNAVALGAYLSQMYAVPHVRHFDITEKHCPRWWVDHPEDWKIFLNRIEAVSI